MKIVNIDKCLTLTVIDSKQWQWICHSFTTLHYGQLPYVVDNTKKHEIYIYLYQYIYLYTYLWMILSLKSRYLDSFIAEKLPQNLVAQSSDHFIISSWFYCVLGGINLFLFHVASSGGFRYLGAAGMAWLGS